MPGLKAIIALGISRWTSSAPQWRAPALWSGLSMTPTAARVSRLCGTPWVRQYLLQPLHPSFACRVHQVQAQPRGRMYGGHVTLRG